MAVLFKDAVAMGTAWFDGEEEEKEKGVAQGLRRPAGECVCEDPLHYLLRVIYGPRSSEVPPPGPGGTRRGENDGKVGSNAPVFPHDRSCFMLLRLPKASKFNLKV